MKYAFKDADVRETFGRLAQDEAFTVKRFWFKRGYLETILAKNLPVQGKTAEKLLRAYNEYSMTDLDMAEIFDNHEIVRRTADDVEFRFGDDPSKEAAFRFIEKVLSIRSPSGMETSPA